MNTRNPIAKNLRSPLYRKRVVMPKKGKGSYIRQKDLKSWKNS